MLRRVTERLTTPTILAGLSACPSLAWASEGLELSTTHYAISGFATFFGVGLAVGFFWFRSRKPASDEGETVYDVTTEAPAPRRRAEAMSISRATPVGGINVDELPSWPTMAQWLPVSQDEKHCPQCQRTFESTVVICPFDSSELVPSPQKGRATTPTQHPGCTECGRVYDSGARYCRADGEKLVPSATLKAVQVHVCQNCGEERLEARQACCDEPDLQVYNPEDQSIVAPLLPLNECPLCLSLHEMGTSHCSMDGQVLRPLSNLNRRLLAVAGQGPRRKVCRDCGRRFSGASTYCSHDGSKLDDLN